MLDYLVHLLDFTISGTDYNLLTTPWLGITTWITRYQTANPNQTASTAVRDAYYDLAKLGFFYSILVIVLIIICTFFVYKLASAFTGWMRFK